MWGNIELSSDEEPTSSIQPSRSNDTFPKSPVKAEFYLRECWKAMSPPVPESNFLGIWCAAIYFSNTSRKKGALYIGKVPKQFFTKEDEFLDSVELDCLKPAYGPSSTILGETTEHLGKDIWCFKACHIISCRLPVSYHLKHKWKYCNYPDFYSFFEMIDKLHRMEFYNSVSKQITC